MIRGRYQFSKVIGFFFNDVSRKEHSEIFVCSSGREGRIEEKKLLTFQVWRVKVDHGFRNIT